MTIRYLSIDEVEKLAGSIWYAPRTRATKTATGEKLATMPAFGLASKSTEFPMRSGEWLPVGTYEVMIEYPMWDIPGKIHVRKYVKAQVKVQDTLTAFFAAVGEYVNKHVLASDDMSIRPICGHPYITKLTPGMSVEDIAFLKSGFCPECTEHEAEFEKMAEAEYQLQQAWDSLQAVPAYTEQYQRYHAGLSAFFQVVALLASQEVDPFSLNWEEANEWRELQDTWELVGEQS